MNIHRHRWEQTAGAYCDWYPEQGGSFSYMWLIPSRCTVCGKTKERMKLYEQPDWIADDAWVRVQVDPYGNPFPETDEERLRRIVREEIAR